MRLRQSGYQINHLQSHSASHKYTCQQKMPLVVSVCRYDKKYFPGAAPTSAMSYKNHNKAVVATFLVAQVCSKKTTHAGRGSGAKNAAAMGWVCMFSCTHTVDQSMMFVIFVTEHHQIIEHILNYCFTLQEHTGGDSTSWQVE